MAAVSGAERAHATLTSTTADTVTLTTSAKEVIVTNHHTVPLYVTVATARTAAGVATPTTAVGAAAGTYGIPAGRTRRIVKSARAVFVKLSVVGNANPYSVEGNKVGLGSNEMI